MIEICLKVALGDFGGGLTVGLGPRGLFQPRRFHGSVAPLRAAPWGAEPEMPMVYLEGNARFLLPM